MRQGLFCLMVVLSLLVGGCRRVDCRVVGASTWTIDVQTGEVVPGAPVPKEVCK